MNERFEFDLVHRLEPPEERERDDVWFERFSLGDDEWAQLLEAVLLPIDPSFTAEKLRTGKASEIFVGPLEGFDLTPIECWDVVDRSEEVLYQLWLFDPSHGVLLEAGSTNEVGRVDWNVFRAHAEKLELHSEHELCQALRHGQVKVRAKHPQSDLCEIRF